MIDKLNNANQNSSHQDSFSGWTRLKNQGQQMLRKIKPWIFHIGMMPLLGSWLVLSILHDGLFLKQAISSSLIIIFLVFLSGADLVIPAKDQNKDQIFN